MERNKKTLVLLCGLPGSGKSTRAKLEYGGAVVLSTDDFFVSASGAYHWNQAGLKKAHIWNQERCRLCMEKNEQLIVIDNCNLRLQDAVPYARLAREFDYELAVDRIETPPTELEALAQRNVHQVDLSTIRDMQGKMERFSVADVWKAAAATKEDESETKETAALRKRCRENLLKGDEEKSAAAADDDDEANSNNNAPSSAAASVTSGPEKLRLEVCKNDGQANPVKALVVAANAEFQSVLKQACSKVSCNYSAKKSRLFDNHGQPLLSMAEMRDGMRVFVSADGKDFIPMKLKMTAAEKREAKLAAAVADGGAAAQGIREVWNGTLAGAAKLASGFSEIVDGLYLGTGRDGRDDAQLLSLSIDTIVNVAFDWPPYRKLPACVRSYTHIPLRDDYTCLLEPFLPEVVSKIDQGKRVLVHCIRGRSRSAAVIVAYLVQARRMRVTEALQVLKRARPDVCINPWFLLQLTQLDAQGRFEDVAQAAGLDVPLFLSKFCVRVDRAEEATHGYFASSPGSKEEFYAVPWNLRRALMQLERATAGSGRMMNLIEMRPKSGATAFHFFVHPPSGSSCDDIIRELKLPSGTQFRCSFPSQGQANRNQKTYLVACVPPFARQEDQLRSLKCFQSPHVCHGCALDYSCPRELGLIVSQTLPTIYPEILPGRIVFAQQGGQSAQLASIDFLNANGKDAAAVMCKQFNLKMNRHAQHRQLFQFTYASQNSRLEDPLVSECRGLIAERSPKDGTWRVVALPFTKFFNLGDARSRNEFDWNNFAATEKMDGALMILYPYEGEWHVATQNVPDGSSVVPGGTLTFRESFFRVFSHLGYKLPPVDDDFVYMFEFMTPKLGLVVAQDEESLVLIGSRCRSTLVEEDVLIAARRTGWRTAARFHFASREDVVEAAAKLTGSVSEGFVLLDGNFNRLKVKAPSYVALFFLKGTNIESAKPIDLTRVVLSGEVIEVSLCLPALKDLLAKYEASVVELISQIESGQFKLWGDKSRPEAGDTRQFLLDEYLEETSKHLHKLIGSNDDLTAAEPQERMSKAEKQKLKAAKKEEKRRNKK